LFIYEDSVFKSDNPRFFGVWHGWNWRKLPSVDDQVLSPWFKHLFDVIADGDEAKYQYINKWIGYIAQNAGSTTAGLILKGIQGAGKNAFTDTLAKLFRGFSNGDITDMEDLLKFNSGIENKVLIVLNEARNAGDNHWANYDKLKAYVVAPTIDISEKYIKKRTVPNVLNVIFTTNNDYRLKIESGDRRYFVLTVNGRYKRDKAYFNAFWKACSGDVFFDNLLTYYLGVETSFDEVRDPPMTEEKQDIIDAGRSHVDRFITEHYTEFVEGWRCDQVMAERPPECTSPKAFKLAILGKCKQVRRRVGTARFRVYVLKNEWLDYYKPQEEDHIDCGVDYD
jgi:hypothetical protein